MKFQEIERIILKDGWALKEIKGSHYHYVHASKQGKVTIKSILKQAGIR